MTKYRHITSMTKKLGDRIIGTRKLVEAERLFTYRGFDLFTHRSEDNAKLWRVSETLSGFTASGTNTPKKRYEGHKTIDEAIFDAKRNIDNYLLKGSLEAIIKSSLRNITNNKSNYLELHKKGVL